MGAIYAFNLDGGSSSAMWYRGSMVAGAHRPLTNVLCVYVKPEPVSIAKLRPPQGLDWRSGHTARPSIGFRAGEMRMWAKLPRKWAGKQSIFLHADRPLRDGWSVSVMLDGEPVGAAGALPAEIALDLSALSGPKHQLWIGVLDEQGNTVGRVDRFFKPGTPGRESW
jgi:hypothetical protein